MVEYLTQIDQKNNIIGKCARPVCHSKRVWHRAVHVLVFDQHDDVFVQKRSRTKDVFPGFYEASLSGHVQWGETAAKAAVRELYEELGVKRKRLKHIGTFKNKTNPEREIVELYVVCNVRDKIRLEKKEVESGQFLPVKEFVRAMKLRVHPFTPGTIAAWKFWKKK